MRQKGRSLAQIDDELRLPNSSAAKALKRLRENMDIIKLVRRLERIQFWESNLDRKKHLEEIRKKQSDARQKGGWLYGRPPAGRYIDDGKLQLEPLESQIIRISGERVISGETVYAVSLTAGYDHRTLRDILKDPLNQELFGAEWKQLQDMLRSPPRGQPPWGFKRFGPNQMVDENVSEEVHQTANLRVKGLSANNIASELRWPPHTNSDSAVSIVVARLKKLHNPRYKRILGDEWQKFVDADNRFKRRRGV